MIVSQGKSVSISYTLTLDKGTVIDSSTEAEPLTYTHGEEMLIAGLEQALEGMRKGESKTVSVQPEDGYGQIVEEAFIQVPLDHLPEDAREVGAQLTAVGPEGQELRGSVASLKEQTATIDFNHPLAGEVLHFQVAIVDIV